MKNNSVKFAIFFESVYRNKGVRAASTELGVSAATISRTCNSLESKLGKRLFNKRGHNFIATKYADTLYESIEQEIYKLRTSLNDFPDKETYIRVSTPTYISLKTFCFASSQYLLCNNKQLPISHRYFKDTNRELIYKSLTTNKLDIIIDSIKPNIRNLESIKIHQDEWVFFESNKLKSENNSPSKYIVPSYDLLNIFNESCDRVIVVEDYLAFLENVYQYNFIGVSALSKIKGNDKFKIVEPKCPVNSSLLNLELYLIYDSREASNSKLLNWILSNCLDNLKIEFN